MHASRLARTQVPIYYLSLPSRVRGAFRFRSFTIFHRAPAALSNPVAEKKKKRATLRVVIRHLAFIRRNVYVCATEITAARVLGREEGRYVRVYVLARVYLARSPDGETEFPSYGISAIRASDL